MRIAMAQINSTVGDLEGNAKKIVDYIEKAKEGESDLVVFPELAIVGYPPQDLLHEKAFVIKNKDTLKNIIEHNVGIVGVIGFVDYDNDGNLYNAAAVLEGNKFIGAAHKTLLPTYDVFDEDRYFKPAKERDIEPFVVEINRKIVSIGVEICEDLCGKKI